MAFGRQVRLVCGTETLDLNDDSYILQAENGWQDQGEALAMRVVVKALTLAELARRVTAVEQMLACAELYHQQMSGEPVYVESKTCDDLSATAEIGATWLRKRVLAGRVRVVSLAGIAAAPAARLEIEMVGEALWRRRAPAPMMQVAVGSASTIARSDGGFTANNAQVSMYARRIAWTSTTGLTIRTFWTHATTATQVNFIRLSAAMRVYAASGTFRLLDETGVNIASSAAQTLVSGTTYEVTIRLAGSDSGVWLNGVRILTYSSAMTWPTDPSTYMVCDTAASCGVQSFLSIQVWAGALTDAQIVDLARWGRPPAEMPYYVTPSDLKATNGVWPVYNVPGQAPAGLRAVLYSAAAQDYDQVRGGVHALKTPTIKFECEAGTLGAATAANANADASAGSQARWTPPDTAWSTQVTVTLASTAAGTTALRGTHRLLLAGYDSAASIQVNNVRWRLVLGSNNGDYSETRSFAAVSTRSLLDLGLVTIPGGAWAADTTATSVKIEIQVQNTTGSGGGTLDLDALYVTPAQQGTAIGNLDVSAWSMVLDFEDTPAALLVSDRAAMTFADWTSWTGHDLLAPAASGVASLLWLSWLRSETEEHFPNDTCVVQWWSTPRWRHG